MRSRRRLRHFSLLALAAAGLAVLPAAPALAASAPAAAPGAVDAGPFTGSQAAFYTPPAQLPQANGAIIRWQDSTVAYLGVPTKRIMYKSTDVNNQPVAVTGTVLLPTAAWTGGGDRPLVSFAAGTQGQGDQCAPSILFNQGLEYEAATSFPMLAAGVAVVFTDYIGLGTPDRVHTYLNRVDEGHAVLDAALAAQDLAGMRAPGVDLPIDGPVGIYGYSQGGGASAAAAELQPSYAPKLNLKGAAAGAPPADLAALAAGPADGSVLTGAIAYAVNGIIQDYPDLAGPVNDLLNQQGHDVLAATKGQCAAETALRYGFQHSRDYTKSGAPISTFLDKAPFADVVKAQLIGTLTPTAPVYIWQGRNDDLVPFEQSLQLAKDWCAKDHHAPVQFKEYNFPVVFPGFAIGHALPAVLGLPEAQGWLYQRFASDAPAPNNCSTLPAA